MEKLMKIYCAEKCQCFDWIIILPHQTHETTEHNCASSLAFLTMNQSYILLVTIEPRQNGLRNEENLV
jgi:hypothetical protein